MEKALLILKIENMEFRLKILTRLFTAKKAARPFTTPTEKNPLMLYAAKKARPTHS